MLEPKRSKIRKFKSVSPDFVLLESAPSKPVETKIGSEYIEIICHEHTFLAPLSILKFSSKWFQSLFDAERMALDI